MAMCTSVYIVGTALGGSDSVQCHTDLDSCCNRNQGPDRGDWYFPNGDRLGCLSSGDIHESREHQRVDLLRQNNADMPSSLIAVLLRPMQSTVITALTSLLERQSMQDCMPQEAS